MVANTSPIRQNGIAEDGDTFAIDRVAARAAFSTILFDPLLRAAPRGSVSANLRPELFHQWLT
jgi:hypothetical protein